MNLDIGSCQVIRYIHTGSYPDMEDAFNYKISSKLADLDLKCLL